MTSCLVLASTSPQRRAILEQLRIPFEVVAPSYVEDDPPGVEPEDLVRLHAEGKARSVHQEGQLTLGVDTAVVLDGRVYGKPVDRADAERMLVGLSGNTHTVVSGLFLLGPEFVCNARQSTLVRFRELSPAMVNVYLDSGEWEGRAGAYAIQGLGARLVDWIRGDYLNVVGLPTARLIACLERHAPNLLEMPR
jgi:septum formation protein